MKAHHILVPALLVFFAPNAASALTSAWNAARGSAVEESTGNIVEVKYSKWFYKCNNMHGSHGRQRCYQEHGLNYQGKRVKSGM
jgi:hypothetical protein